MFSEEEKTDIPDTILRPQNFFLLQSELISKIKEVSSSVPLPDELQAHDGFYFLKDKIFIPESLRLETLRMVHDHPLAGHMGVSKTLDLARRFFHWPRMAKDCKTYVSSCETCARSKDSRTKPLGLLHPLPIPSRLWGSISIDFIVDLPPSQGFNTIFVVVDRLSKMAHFIPLSGTPSAAYTAEVFIKEIIRLHGVSDEIVSDRGVQFTSKFWRALCDSLKIKLAFSTAFHPQSNGQTERTNQTLEQYLRCFSSFLQDNWSKLLPLAEFSYNNACHSSTKQTPFFANFGCHPHILPNFPKEIQVPAVQDRLLFISKNVQVIQQAMTQAQRNFKVFADRKWRRDPEFRVGDLVWLSTRHIKLPCPSKKLGQRFLGPFPVVQQINEVAFKLKLPTSYKIHPVFHSALLKTRAAGTMPHMGARLSVCYAQARGAHGGARLRTLRIDARRVLTLRACSLRI
uniref:Gypsy retrotransposon integrase-like protein 1 n=1 Tax=Xenopus tropicalis TaxID=8364 RepID=A0A803JS76_XENTR